jgi:nucleotide-binding universal stress UspA family protein
MAPGTAAHRRASPVRAGYHRLLVPISGTAESERAMETACALAAEHGASVTAVFVVEVSPLLPLDASMSDEEAEAREALVRAEAIADTFGLRVHTRSVRSRDSGKAIVDLVESEDTELVVIGASRGRRPGRRWMAFDGTVRHVLAKAPCRVMVVAGPS